MCIYETSSGAMATYISWYSTSGHSVHVAPFCSRDDLVSPEICFGDEHEETMPPRTELLLQ